MSEGESDSEKAASESLSQFLARVLDQLSTTAWLPALALVGIVLVLTELSRYRGSATSAFSAIGSLGFGAIALLVAGVVVATMFTQAFEFAAIRTIEGYWRPTGPIGYLARWRSASHRRKRKRFINAHMKAQFDAIQTARRELRQRGHSSSAIDAMECYLTNTPLSDELTPADRSRGKALVENWKTHADPTAVQRMDGLARRIQEYPDHAHRVLPTQLGNVVRAVEDRVHRPADGKLETFAIHVIDQLPNSIAAAFIEQRRRLNLYCCLTFVLAAAIVPSVTLGRVYDARYAWTGIVVPAILAISALISYRASIASGRLFGLALTAIKEHRDRNPARRQTAGRADPPSPGP